MDEKPKFSMKTTVLTLTGSVGDKHFSQAMRISEEVVIDEEILKEALDRLSGSFIQMFKNSMGD